KDAADPPPAASLSVSSLDIKELRTLEAAWRPHDSPSIHQVTLKAPLMRMGPKPLLLTLPFEVLLQIASHLGKPSLLAGRISCRALRAVFSEARQTSQLYRRRHTLGQAERSVPMTSSPCPNLVPCNAVFKLIVYVMLHPMYIAAFLSIPFTTSSQPTVMLPVGMPTCPAPAGSRVHLCDAPVLLPDRAHTQPASPQPASRQPTTAAIPTRNCVHPCTHHTAAA
ncbi:hypothetical protein HaLaN_26424, partial [Haematococcus lacustris]